MTDRLLSISETSELLGIKRTKLYQHLNSGELSAVKNGRRTLIRQSEAERYSKSLPKARFSWASLQDQISTITLKRP